MVQSSNKRIAINTMFMYARLFITMAIGLYTSRVVLLVLGVSDYGLFSVVGGVLALFGFITGSLGAATSRFLNAEMGKPNGDVNKIFNINLTLHIFFALGLFILAETVGLWYVYNKLEVDASKLSDAVFIYHASIITTCVGIVNTPCSSLFCAKEKFGFQSALDIVNTIIRLICVIAMQYYDGNHIRFYTLIMCFTTANSFVIYHILAVKWWPEIMKWRFVKELSNYRSVLSFGSWNLLDSASMVARNSGSDLIINSFFGTAINGTFAISKTIFNYVMTFSSNFDGASGPQIIQSYSAGDLKRCYYLVYKMGRFGLLLFEFVLFPLWIELDFILQVWLKVVPEGVIYLTKLNLVLAAVALSSGGIYILINASGRIKWFKILKSFLFLVCLPLGYILYKNGCPAYTMMILFIVSDIIQRILQLVLMKRILHFDSLQYVKEAYFKPLVIASLMSFFINGYSCLSVEHPLLKFLAIIVCGVITTNIIVFYGLTKGERLTLYSFLKTKFIKQK